ncbi:malto-oligosyltrehalose trehalohydrolase [Ornithinimicrobium tianjinense]|uniref:Malto-oligosyltrehalose trehalohydrolase n=1 Tax=Ornithinimicrobium tianjinense TaxID=1195761 RepID=A0A917BUB1_9MICO|nr:malto-oligosyltrehalose trehalohydrolase [Ornithinimicrobium tianjinense]GGF56600.1 malto-oligosyltrehalose trehalohydrolase [Ornithinimicrobium tianjinense]
MTEGTRTSPGPLTFRLWAPDARTVELRLGADGATTVPMVRGDDGWWEVTTDPGDGRYAYSLDGGSPVPDPRSRWQPDGVHAPSALVDPAAFPWTDAGWRGVPLEDAVVYELHVGTFTPERTFDGVVAHLDHLVDLGVTVVELMPVAAFPGRHGWGYDGVAPYAVHAPYGGPAGLARLVDAAHAHGLAVWLDVVHNHLGPSGNYLGQVAPYFTDRHHTPWGAAVNLDGPGSDEVRAYLLDNVRLWLEDYHLDGLRLDAVHALHDERATHLLEEMAALADEIGERTGIPRTLVAESDRNDPATVTPRAPGGAGGLGLHGQWADDVHHALHVALTGEAQGYYADFADPQALPKVLGTTPFFHDGTYSTFRGRVHGRAVDPSTTPGRRFVASLQTHDQVGNRATGDRLGHGIPLGRAAAGAALLLTSPYTPMLFMGEEWGASTPWQYFTDHQEEWLAEAVRQGRQAEFAEHGWGAAVPDPQDEGTVTASTLRWEEVAREGHRELLAFYRQLIHLRRTVPALRSVGLGEVEVCRGPGAAVTVRRGDVRVVAVLGGGSRGGGRVEGELPEGAEVLARFGAVQLDGGRIVVGPDSVVVLGGCA